MKQIISAIILLAVAASNAATVITSGSISWTITESVTTGQYINGDWWVLDPGGGLTWTAVTRPSGIASRDGSMLNVTPRRVDAGGQGLDGRGGQFGGYSAALNVAESLPLTLVGGDVVISTISRDVNNVSARPVIQNSEVLTVVSNTPAADAFRPWYVDGLTRVEFTESQLLTNLFDIRLSLAAGKTSPSSQAGALDGVWNDFMLEWTHRHARPSADTPDYVGRVNQLVGDALLHLFDDVPLVDKHSLIINAVQQGIDIYGIAQWQIDNFPNYGTIASTFAFDGVWGYIGGDLDGYRKPLVLVAGMALNYAPMRDINIDNDPRFIWGQDGQFFYLTEEMQQYTYDQDNVDFTSGWSRPGFYDDFELGTPVWAERAWQTQNRSTYNVVPGKQSYLRQKVDSTLSIALFVKMMGWEDKWNFGPSIEFHFRDHVADGWVNNLPMIGYTSYGSDFSRAMFDLYSDYAPPSGSNPNQPSGFEATAVSTSQINLTWVDNSDDEDAFTIERSTTSGSGFAVIGEAAANATNYSATGLSPSTTYYFRVASSNSVGMSSYTAERNATTLTETTIVATPTVDVSDGNFIEEIYPVLSTATSGATIRFRTDGGTPTSSFAAYSNPIRVNEDRTIKFFGTKAAADDSSVASVTYDFPPFQSVNGWQSAQFNNRTNTFSVYFICYLSATNTDAVVALADGRVTQYTDGAALFRFNTQGSIDVRSNNVYTATSTVAYPADSPVFVALDVNIPAKTYDVTVRVNDTTTEIADDFPFRGEQASVGQLNHLGWINGLNPGDTLTIDHAGFHDPRIPFPNGDGSGGKTL